MPYTALTLSSTARIDDNVGFFANSTAVGVTNIISKNFISDNGAWGQSTTANEDIQYVYGNGYWVSYSQGVAGIKYSTGNPPSSWTAQSVGSDTITSVAYGNGYWVAVTSTGEVWYRASTPNGTWTLGADLITGQYPDVDGNTSMGILTSVAYANGYWVILKESPYYPEFLAVFYRDSTPVGAWTRQNITTDGYTGYRRYANLIYANGYWVFPCIGSINVANIHGFCYRANTPNGTWTYQPLTISGIAIPCVTKIRYGNGYWVILDVPNNGIYYTNGALNSTWVGGRYEDDGDAYDGFLGMYDIIYANDYWIITYQTESGGAWWRAGIIYKYGNPTGAPMAQYPAITDWMRENISGSGNVNSVSSAWYNRTFNASIGGGTPNYLLLSGAPYTKYHKFPSPQPVAQTQTYSLIQTGGWYGEAYIDNYAKTFSTVVPTPPSGAVTFAIKDKDLT
jgi:hypothetical protein